VVATPHLVAESLEDNLNVATLAQAPESPAEAKPTPPRWTGIPARLFLTCWAIYALHFSPFVVRELYLAMNLAEKGSVRVDEYADLHADLTRVEGRGVFVAGNPGVAFLAAVPYRLALPLVNRLAPVRPPPAGEESTLLYKEERPNRQAFYRKVRARGLDIRLGAAATIASVFFMVPLAALGAVVLYRIFARLKFGEEQSMWLALLYALGTPIFLRAGILNQNLTVALLGLFSFVLLWRKPDSSPRGFRWRLFFAGFLAGYSVFADYTGVVVVAALGLFVLLQESREGTVTEALSKSVPFVTGALLSVSFLLVYQWYSFGSPWFPVQYYMPREVVRGYPSEHGFGAPQPAALWGLLFDPLYGLFVFAPILALAFYHPVLVRRGLNRVPAHVAALAWVLSIGLWVFCACIHYTLRHQWQDGVRYMVPAVPFLFLLVADVMARMQRVWAVVIAAAAVFETWCLAMVREAPLISISRVVNEGLELPWLTTVTKAAPQYFPALAQGASPLPLFVFLALLIWILWRTGRRRAGA
jgi:hypothetical protein